NNNNNNKKKEEKESLCEKEKENVYNPPLLFFPEECYTNGRTLIQFNSHHPIFISAMSIQPIIIRYPYTYFDQSWCSVDSPWWLLLLKTMSQVYNTVEIIYLPVYNPSLDEKQNPHNYAENIHHLMARYMKVPETAHNINDVRLLCLARSLHIPIEVINVETAHPHFAIIPYKRIEHMLRRFATIVHMKRRKRREEKLQEEKEVYKRQRRRRRRYQDDYTEGFLTSDELGEFFTPFQYYPILLERFLYHLSRRAAVRGMYVSFRDFLSAMHTEPIAWNPNPCIQEEERKTVYMDEIESESDMMIVLRRTFAMMLLAGHTLRTQQKEYKDNNIPSTNDTTTTTMNINTDTEGRLTHSLLYGHTIRYPSYTSHNNILLTPIDVAITMAADDSIYERQLSHNTFNILLDILFTPHRSTIWGGAATKSRAQLKEENTLFEYIRTGTFSHEEGMKIKEENEEERNKAERNEISYITLHAFLRFARKHPALTEYFHACCEHYLLGDDLA
ncbi:uncharacterized protein TM35_000421430, partial [Trypanosoma theileri]